jgi:hypothetical protein
MSGVKGVLKKRQSLTNTAWDYETLQPHLFISLIFNCICRQLTWFHTSNCAWLNLLQHDCSRKTPQAPLKCHPTSATGMKSRVAS